MALPVFQSLDQVRGDLAINFVSRLDQANIVPGLEDLKPGSPFLAIFDSIAQSRMRSQQTMMEVLDGNDIDNPEADLDRIGAKEKVPRLGQTFARGSIDIGDSSFQKIATKLYHGAAAPIPGTLVISVVNASSFPISGQLYIGRGTTNFEGPLTYTSTSNLGPNWTITLSSGTTNFHALTEVVTLAQGGDRAVSAGQVVSTPAGGSTPSISFATTQNVIVPDGEVSLQGVDVVCQTPGRVGNVPRGAIKDVPVPAFTGMTVTNPLPIQNARDTENDTDYRARIKAVKASRQLATKTAIETFAVGLTSPDENSTITAASLVRRHLRPTFLAIDDGSGYEEKTEGINYEVIVDSAIGGENTFQLIFGRPVAKAFSTTVLRAPYSIQNGAILAVEVGGIHAEHAFSVSDFRNISNATAFEIVASINADSDLSFNARTTNSGSQITIFAKDEERDDIQVTSPFAGTDANTYLGFPTGRFDTLFLYKNDRLLQKDGKPATITAQGQGSWQSMDGSGSNFERLTINVDGTGSRNYDFNDVTFSNLGIGLVTLESTNPLSSWAAVFNAKIPGVTTTVNGSFLELTSNKGNSVGASLSIDPASTLAIKGMFNPAHLSAVGRGFDYILDRPLGQVELVVPLSPGDRLTAGTPFTRGYIESNILGPSVVVPPVPPGGANYWFFVDGDAETVPVGLNGSIYLSPTTSAFNPNVAITAKDVVSTNPIAIFSNLEVGDWFIQTKAGVGPLSIVGAWRISNVNPGGFLAGSTIEVEIPWSLYTLSDSDGTVFDYTTFVRATSEPQRKTVATGTYSLAQFASLVEPTGATASVFSDRVRISTNTFSTAGDIALMAQDANALTVHDSAPTTVGFPIGLVTNNEPHVASVESINGELGTPNFNVQLVSDYIGSTMTAGGPVITNYREGLIDQLFFMRPPLNVPVTSRISTLDKVHDPINAITSTSVFDVAVDPNLLITDTEFTGQSDYIEGVSLYRFGPESTLNVTMNQDPIGGGFEVPIFRRLIADSATTYGAILTLKDQDLLVGGLPSTLNNAFGHNPDFDFSNFALHMRARGEVDSGDATKSVLWRKRDFTGSLSTTFVKYIPPTIPAQLVSISQVEPDGSVYINLPSGADDGVLLNSNQKLYFVLASKAVISAYGISSITRAGDGVTVTATLTAPFGVTPGTGMPPTTAIWVDITSANFVTGPKTITATGVNTITWLEAGAVITETPSGADAAWGPTPADFSVVHVGDYSNGWLNYFSSTGTHLMNVSAISLHGVQFSATTGFVQGLQAVSGTDVINFYPVSQSISGTSQDLTATVLVNQVNALGGIVIGTVIGTGLGIVSKGYPDDINATALLQDGILHIQSSAWNGTNYNLTLKFNPLVASLDYANETFRLVPTTAKNLSDFLSTPAVTGMSLGGADLERADRAEHVQIASTTLGTLGAVQVTGGNANDLLLSSVGSASVVTGVNIKVPVRTSADLSTLPTLCWALVHTSQVVPKHLNWTALASLQFFTNGAPTSGSKVRVSGGGGAIAWSSPSTVLGTAPWYVERHGRFVAYSFQGLPGSLAGVGSGDWVVVSGTNGSLANRGTFRVIQTVNNTFWIDNPNAIEEVATFSTVTFFTYESLMPGDIFQVRTSAFGVTNQGLWTVIANDKGIGDDPGVFYVTQVLANSGPTVIGTALPFLTVVPSEPTTSFGLIQAAIQEPTDPTITNLYFADINGRLIPELYGQSAGAVIQTLDRLEFPTELVIGQDGYTHDIGLIAAANQVLYGDESDPDTYPGVVAVGDDVFIGPPLIRRVFISVAVREVSGSDTTSGVQSAIAQVINSAGGKPVPISDYLAAAGKVTGVISIIPLDPVPVEGADTIPVQPGEAARVLDIDNDIQVSVIGA